MSITVSSSYSSYQCTVGMSYFGRYGHASDRTASLPLANYRGISDGGDKLEQLARSMEYYYINYSGQCGTHRAVRQPKISTSGGLPQREPLVNRDRGNYYRAGKRSCSVPVITASSILKCTNSPPCASPKEKKTVRFADSQGLPLATVHQKSDSDQDDLSLDKVCGRYLNLSAKDEGKALKGQFRLDSPPDSPSQSRFELEYHFTQPGIEADFMERVLREKVCLENIHRDGGNVRGIVRVCNIDYHKSVTIRWTNNKWRSVHDKLAMFCAGGSDNTTDRFSFQLPLAGSQLEFAICYKVAGGEFWDNNREKNYTLTVKSEQLR